MPPPVCSWSFTLGQTSFICFKPHVSQWCLTSITVRKPIFALKINVLLIFVSIRRKYKRCLRHLEQCKKHTKEKRKTTI